MANVDPQVKSGNTQQLSAVSSASSNHACDWWWVSVPGTLLKFSRNIFATATDGIYLTAWPKLAVMLPLVVFLGGLIEGLTHYSLIAINDNSVSYSDTSIAFAQNLILVLLAAAVGSLSANLGLTLVFGFAIGDYLIAAPQMQLASSHTRLTFFAIHVPQLVSYLLFFVLAALPTMGAQLLVDDLGRRMKSALFDNRVTRTIFKAVFQALLVIGWIYMAPMVFRIFWTFNGGDSSPVTVVYFKSRCMPWLPLVAFVFTLVRGFLESQGLKSAAVQARLNSLRSLVAAYQTLAAKMQPSSGLLRGLMMTILFTLMCAGYFSSLLIGGIFIIVSGVILVGHYTVLAKIPLWTKWIGAVCKLPIALRVIVTVIVTYFVSRAIILALGLNTTLFRFDSQLFSLIASLLLCIAFGMYDIENIPADASLRPTISPELRRATQVGIVIVILFLLPRQLHAVCVEGACCMGDPDTSAWTPVPPPLIPTMLASMWASVLNALGGDKHTETPPVYLGGPRG